MADLPAAGDSEDFGKLSVDLSQLAMTTRYEHTAAHVDLGRLEITVPKMQQRSDQLPQPILERFARTAVGVQAGSDLSGPDPGSAANQPSTQHTLTLNLSVDAGNIEVQR